MSVRIGSTVRWSSFIQAGVLDGVAGVVLGNFQNCDERRDEKIVLVRASGVAKRLRSLGIPVFEGGPFGHHAAPRFSAWRACAKISLTQAAGSFAPSQSFTTCFWCPRVMWEDPAVEPAISRAVGTYVREQIFSSAAVAAGRMDTIFHCEIIGRTGLVAARCSCQIRRPLRPREPHKALGCGFAPRSAVGKGKVSLDGTSTAILPSAKDSAWGKRQVWQLASHVSGASAIPQGLSSNVTETCSIFEMDLAGWIRFVIGSGEGYALEALFELEPIEAPGKTTYSDLGFWVLGWFSRTFGEAE